MSSSQQLSLRYSQNFLCSRRLIDQLLARSSLRPDDVVLEIGAGRGIITERLARRCRKVVAIEKDPGLAEVLRRRFGTCTGVQIREADFLETPLPQARYKVFASIPFNITTEIVARLTASPNPPDDAYLVVQREAAARFMGEPRGSLWAALLKPWFEPAILHRFRRTDFDPPPRVDVALLRLRKRGPPLVAQGDAALYRDFVSHCFAAWRPSLLGTLEATLGRCRAARLAWSAGLGACETPSMARFEQWLALFAAFKALDSPEARRAVARSAGRLRSQQRKLQKSHRTRRPPPLGPTDGLLANWSTLATAVARYPMIRPVPRLYSVE